DEDTGGEEDDRTHGPFPTGISLPRLLDKDIAPPFVALPVFRGLNFPKSRPRATLEQLRTPATRGIQHATAGPPSSAPAGARALGRVSRLVGGRDGGEPERTPSPGVFCRVPGHDRHTSRSRCRDLHRR